MYITRMCAECNIEKTITGFSACLFNSTKHRKIKCNDCLNSIARRKRRMNGIKSGWIYVITNNAWAEWVKVGMTTKGKIEDRILSYNTCSPYSDFTGKNIRYFDDIFTEEKAIHQKLNALSLDVKSEWFKISIEDAIHLINTH